MRYVEHLVLVKVKRPFTPEEVSRMQALRALDGVCWISCGANYTHRGLGYNYGITVRFTREEAEVAYQEHPMHVAVREEVIKPNVDMSQPNPILAIDYVHDQPPRYGLLALGFACGLLAGVGLTALRLRK